MKMDTPHYIWHVKQKITKTVILILDKNADINSVSRFGDTPLSLACEGGYADIIQELLQNKVVFLTCSVDW